MVKANIYKITFSLSLYCGNCDILFYCIIVALAIELLICVLFRKNNYVIRPSLKESFSGFFTVHFLFDIIFLQIREMTVKMHAEK